VQRSRVPAASQFAESVGYSRAIRDGHHVTVAGTAPIMADGSEPAPDAYGQARRCLEIIVAALAQLGARPEHVVRTRIYLTRVEDFEQVARAHGEVFRDVRPANTTVVVAALVDPRWLVEIEADAVIT
jgi:enamine deaminase RidA (YjgF/YER057c/UK114 family)